MRHRVHKQSQAETKDLLVSCDPCTTVHAIAIDSKREGEVQYFGCDGDSLEIPLMVNWLWSYEMYSDFGWARGSSFPLDNRLD